MSTDKPSLPAVEALKQRLTTIHRRRVLEQDFSDLDGVYADFAWLCVRAEAIPPPQTWQPIETAPKDGTRIRLLTPFCDAGGRRCYEMFTGSWQTNEFGSFWEDEECAEESHPEYWKPLDDAIIAASPPHREETKR